VVLRHAVAALHESGNGTYRMCRAKLTMSVDKSKAEVELGRGRLNWRLPFSRGPPADP
jgi:hypothetical protein